MPESFPYLGNQAVPALAPKLLTSSLLSLSLPQLAEAWPSLLEQAKCIPTPPPQDFQHALLSTWNALPSNFLAFGWLLWFLSLISAEGHSSEKLP